MDNTLSDRIKLAFGYIPNSDHKYYKIFKDEFWKMFWKLRDDLKLEVYEDIKSAIRIYIEFDITKINPSTTADTTIDNGMAIIRFNPDTIDKSWKLEEFKNFKDLDTYIKYLAYHECCHVIGALIDPYNKENAQHGKFYKDLMNRYRSEYTKVPFWTDKIHSNFSSEIVTFRHTSFCFKGMSSEDIKNLK